MLFLEDVCTGPLQPIRLFLHRCVQLKPQGREPATALSMAQTRKPATPLPWARGCCEGAERLCLGLPRKVKVHWWRREGAHTSVQQGVTISKALCKGQRLILFSDTLWRHCLLREVRCRRDQKHCYLSGISKGRLRGAGAPAPRDSVSITFPLLLKKGNVMLSC